MPGAALTAMLRGKTLHGFHPKDAERKAALLAAARKRERKQAQRTVR
jgi:hypothetical protein